MIVSQHNHINSTPLVVLAMYYNTATITTMLLLLLLLLLLLDTMTLNSYTTQ